MVHSGAQGITDEQAALQMGAWAIFAAPLIMGNDVRNLTRAQRNILLNKSVIAVNQDPLGTTFLVTQVQVLPLLLQDVCQQMHVMLMHRLWQFQCERQLCFDVAPPQMQPFAFILPP